MKTHTSLSLNEAAKASGKGKATLHRAIKDGRLSAKRLDNGEYVIEPAELFRAFPVEQHGTPSGTPNGTVRNTDGTAQLIAALERERESMAETIRDLRQRLDDEVAERKRMTLMLSHIQETQTERGNNRLLDKLFGKRGA